MIENWKCYDAHNEAHIAKLLVRERVLQMTILTTSSFMWMCANTKKFSRGVWTLKD